MVPHLPKRDGGREFAVGSGFYYRSLLGTTPYVEPYVHPEYGPAICNILTEARKDIQILSKGLPVF